MGLTSNIFGKEIYDLQLNDLEIFFQAGQEENAILEFKTGDVSLENIYKEVAAFLNTEGGLLVIGSPRETPFPDDKKKKICKGALTPSTSITNQDTLFRNIASNISPAPLHIKAKSFSASEGYVYVLEIPQSLIPPHQVSGNGVYYIRLEREAKPAPHGLVEALFQKRQRPDISAEMNCYQKHGNLKSIFLEFKIRNLSLVTAESFGTIVTIAGVRKFIETDGLPQQPGFSNETIRHQYHDKGSILVRGLEFDFTIEFEPLYPCFYVSFEYYCLHSEAHSLTYTIDKQGKVIASNNSRDLADENEKIIIADAFLETKKVALAKLLSIAHPFSGGNAVNLTGLYELESKLKIKFPFGYLDYLFVQNGYVGKVRNAPIILFSVEEMYQRAPARIPGQDLLVIIGKLGEASLTIRFNHEKPMFGLLSFDNSKMNFTPVGLSFYSLLEQFATGLFDELYEPPDEDFEEE